MQMGKAMTMMALVAGLALATSQVMAQGGGAGGGAGGGGAGAGGAGAGGAGAGGAGAGGAGAGGAGGAGGGGLANVERGGQGAGSSMGQDNSRTPSSSGVPSR